MNKYQSIIDKLYSEDINEVNVIMHDNNFNPNDILKRLGSKVILSQEVYEMFVYLLNECKNNKREYGCFIFGNEIDSNIYYFNKLPKTFFKSNVDSIDVTKENIKELLELIESDKYISVVHFHTHPSLERTIPDNYSDQDLYVYSYLQIKLQNYSKNVSYFGALFSTNDEKISFVFYDDFRKCFYRIEEIYVLDNNMNLYNLDTKEKKYFLKNKKILTIS